LSSIGSTMAFSSGIVVVGETERLMVLIRRRRSVGLDVERSSRTSEASYVPIGPKGLQGATGSAACILRKNIGPEPCHR
jgi:hypothetical protein